MYAFIWSHMPGPAWFKIFVIVVVVGILLLVCFQSFFPWIAPMLPFNDQVDEPIGEAIGSLATP